MIAEFEGLIDEFTIIEQGRGILTMEADSARARFQKIRARFAEPLPSSVTLPGALDARRDGRQIELLCNGDRRAAAGNPARPSSGGRALRSAVAGGDFCRLQNPQPGQAMSVLVRKEIRLLLPAWIAALAAAALPLLAPADY